MLRSLPKLNSNLDAFRSYIKKELNQKLLSVSNEITDQLNKGQNTLSTIQSKLNTINQVINAGQDILSKGKNELTRFKVRYQASNKHILTQCEQLKITSPQ